MLLHLSHADEGMLRRVDLAERVLLTASGITRLLEGLERAGYVCKQTCASDARVSYAQLTDAGATKLSEAAKTHLRGIDELFTGRYSGSELATLAELLSRLPTTGSACKSAVQHPGAEHPLARTPAGGTGRRSRAARRSARAA